LKKNQSTKNKIKNKPTANGRRKKGQKKKEKKGTKIGVAKPRQKRKGAKKYVALQHNKNKK
jgi:hypothetical protein